MLINVKLPFNFFRVGWVTVVGSRWLGRDWDVVGSRLLGHGGWVTVVGSWLLGHDWVVIGL